MALSKQLSLYWGNNTLYFTEIVSFKPVKSFSVPFELQKPLPTEDNKFISSSMQVVSAIETQLKNHNITTTTLNLSLPTKDIIFRSFFIPWMSSNDIRNVVTFEISKYIPFSLEELRYSYHPVTINENNVKKIKIIFVAVRKDTLENYTNILESAGLQPKMIEPCSQSIIRAFIAQKLLNKDQTTAIIEKGELAGKITIVDRGIPQFVREFQLRVNAKESGSDTDITSRLINEIRISIDYLTRQEHCSPVSEIKIIANHQSENLAESLASELNIPTVQYFLQDIFQNPEVNNIAYLNAFGIGIFNSINLESNFDLSKKDTVKTKNVIKEPANFSGTNSIISTLLICGGIAAFAFFISSNIVSKPRKKIAKLEAELGINKDVSIEKIESETNKTNDSLEYFKSVRNKSTVAYYLTNLPNLLPPGVWIKSFDVTYPDSTLIPEKAPAPAKASNSKSNDKKSQETLKKSLPIKIIKPSILLSGYAYSENIRDEFKMVNQFLKNIRDNQQLSSIFSQITLETVKAEKKDEITVTYYEIKCK